MTHDLAPSCCFHGFIDDPRCPILFGRGFGPKPYYDLFQIWEGLSEEKGSDVSSDSSQESTMRQQQDAAIKLLLSRIKNMSNKRNGKQVVEGVLSGAIANTFQVLLPLYSQNKSLCVQHQAFVPSGSSSCIDIAITDSLDCSVTDLGFLHSLIEVNWSYSEDKFPEAQACATARCFSEASSFRHPWVPIFVMSRTHLKIGLAYECHGVRWYYSEIFEYVKDCSFSPDSEDDVLMFSRFTDFLFRAADYSTKFAGLGDGYNFVDKAGSKILANQVQIIGDRVLKGEDISGEEGVLKFYANHNDASKALENQRLIEAAMGKDAVRAKLIIGCGSDGMCAIVDKYLKFTIEITYRHVINLVQKIGALHRQGLLHGDVRLQNIVFGAQDSVSLIDFDWAGKIGEAKFPFDANPLAFGTRARMHVERGKVIPKMFDWLCVADILEQIKCTNGAKAAANGYEAETIRYLERVQQEKDGQELCSMLTEVELPFLNLSCVSNRVRAFHIAEMVLETDAAGKGSLRKRRRSNSSELILYHPAQ